VAIDCPLLDPVSEYPAVQVSDEDRSVDLSRAPPPALPDDACCGCRCPPVSWFSLRRIDTVNSVSACSGVRHRPITRKTYAAPVAYVRTTDRKHERRRSAPPPVVVSSFLSICRPAGRPAGTGWGRRYCVHRCECCCAGQIRRKSRSRHVRRNKRHDRGRSLRASVGVPRPASLPSAP